MTIEEYKTIIRNNTHMPFDKINDYANRTYNIGLIEEWSRAGEVPEITAIHDLHVIPYETGIRLWEAKMKVLSKLSMVQAEEFLHSKMEKFIDRFNMLENRKYE